MILREVNPDNMADVRTLYRLLQERTPEQSISHKAMPTFDRHYEFVANNSYLAWYILSVGMANVGSIYLSQRREIGVFVFRMHQRKGYARAAVEELMRMHPGKFLANVAPGNGASHALWRSFGGKQIQVTYEL